jgi:hypothetical protein
VNKDISDFGALVGLLLALATLLTANRSSALTYLEKSAPRVKQSDRQREIILNLALCIVTFLAWLGGLPLAVRAVGHLHPLNSQGPLRSVFIMTWVLLLGLMAWQASLVVRAFRLQLSPGGA